MRDPVSGFEYPESWVKLCTDSSHLSSIQQGLAVLTADGSVRMRGFTTGSTAAAAAKAAVLSLSHSDIWQVTILTPVHIPIQVMVSSHQGIGHCSKYAGDYPGDVTAGLEFIAVARPAESGITIEFGEGIGRWDRNTPRYHKGDPAVSAQARSEINTAIQEAVHETGIPGVLVRISSPQGKEVAEKTLNRMIGVTNGISILGTTGFVEPWDDHLEEAVLERAAQTDRVVLTTGRVGMRFARLLFPTHEVILAGSRLGTIIPHLSGTIIICGLPALVLKYVNPHFLDGTGYTTVEELMSTDIFLPAMNTSLQAYKREHPTIRVVVVNREGKVIGDST